MQRQLKRQRQLKQQEAAKQKSTAKGSTIRGLKSRDECSKSKKIRNITADEGGYGDERQESAAKSSKNGCAKRDQVLKEDGGGNMDDAEEDRL